MRIKALLLLSATSVIVSCSTLPYRAASTGELGKDEAIAIAMREVQRRGERLPIGPTTIEADETIVEVGPNVPTYVVSFNTSPKATKAAVFVVVIDRRNGAVQEFIDTRKLIPARRIHALRRR
jgi:hypothetical protein